MVPGVIHFVILEHCILALPGPDTCCHTTEITLAIVALIDLPSSSVRNVMLDQRTETVHGGNGVTAGVFHEIAPDDNLCCPVTLCHFVRDFLCGKMVPVGRVGQSNAPAADILDNAVLNSHIMIPGNTSDSFVLWVKYGEVNAAIVHVLIVNIAFHILDIQMIQINMVQGAFILSCHRNTGTIHGMKIVIGDGLIHGSVGNCNVSNLDICTVK